ncbi:transcription factor GTE7-like [Rutidosis leptorrhynchoides]|uniref:transcription factor GTE7-like n=1 Tax=Rutidosis leptorrhynchoides TaxID=125765 RepID=UPI003A994B11
MKKTMFQSAKHSLSPEKLSPATGTPPSSTTTTTTKTWLPAPFSPEISCRNSKPSFTSNHPYFPISIFIILKFNPLMASAIFHSRNESRANESRATNYMTSYTNTSNPNFTRFHYFQNPKPNPNPNRSNYFIDNTTRDVFRQNHAPPPPSRTPAINAVPSNNYSYRYITFRLSSYTRHELKQLKKRLMSDLNRIRTLRHTISSIPAPQYKPESLPATTLGQKRMKPVQPVQPVRETKKQRGRVKNTANAQKGKFMMRKCGQILVQLMKHKHGWVFNTPVDVAGLKLYDYHKIITQPMDLGTIKLKLTKNEYESPLAFAADVRLTFNNAMVYNGIGSDVYVMAQQLLSMFENLFNSTADKKQKSSSISVLTNQVKVMSKRVMTRHEKEELAESFWKLQMDPQGMDQVMSIVKKGVFLGLEQKGHEEFELDLGVLDNETLWELHRFICEYGNKGVVVSNLDSSVQNANVAGRDVGDEDVDIGEEMQFTNISCVEIEKDDVNGGNSSSGDGSGSSSSDSDSSSSDSGSSLGGQEANSTSK